MLEGRNFGFILHYISIQYALDYMPEAISLSCVREMPIRILASTLITLAEIICDFTQSLQASTAIALLRHAAIFPLYQLFQVYDRNHTFIPSAHR
jgi:hypothetical protein